MTGTNLIDFGRGDIKRPIFRIFSFQRFLDTLASHELTLVRPRLWDDPFENFILQARFRQSDGTLLRLPAGARLYGQCWSLTKESDALWRIYAPCKDGVKVRASVRTFARYLHDVECRRPTVACFLGKVRYISRLNLPEKLATQFDVAKVLSPTGEMEHARSLLFKRNAFAYEDEVRLVGVNRDTGYDADTLGLPLNPIELFDQVIFDPGMSMEEYEERRAQIMQLGYPRERIKRSGLYGRPEVVFDIPPRAQVSVRGSAGNAGRAA